MSRVHVIVPDLFLPQGVAAEATAGLALHALETLLARARPEALHVDTLESLLCEMFGVQDQAIAPITLQADGMDVGMHYWLRADPVHLSMQRDQLILHAGVQPDADEAAQLCASLNEHFAADGLRFFAPHPQRWYLCLEDVPDLDTVMLARVEGCNVYEHLPQGGDALRWHALFNEIQMLLYAHPVNAAREVRGEPAINSVWLWGGGLAAGKLSAPCSKMCTDNPLAAAFAQAADIPCAPLPEKPCEWEAGDMLVIWEGLRRAYRHDDLQAWREELLRLERNCAGPLFDALRSGRVGEIVLDAVQEGGSRRFVLTRGAAWKLWLRSRPLPAYAIQPIDSE